MCPKWLVIGDVLWFVPEMSHSSSCVEDLISDALMFRDGVFGIWLDHDCSDLWVSNLMGYWKVMETGRRTLTKKVGPWVCALGTISYMKTVTREVAVHICLIRWLILAPLPLCLCSLGTTRQVSSTTHFLCQEILSPLKPKEMAVFHLGLSSLKSWAKIKVSSSTMLRKFVTPTD